MALQRSLADERATILCGQDIAAVLQAGDVLALKGDLGTGKTMLARAIIRAFLANPDLEVPSPTFTLVQVYEGRLPIQHFDLYRLSDPSELLELGFDEAGKRGIAIVEWPEKAGGLLPEGALLVELEHEGEGRGLAIDGPAAAIARIERSFAARDFLERASWGEADRAWSFGDASARSYETVTRAGVSERLLMNSPRLVLGPPVRDGKSYAEIAHTAQTVTAFVAVARALKERGFAVPEIYNQDLDRGFLLIKSLGHGGFLDREGRPVATRYTAAAELLAAIHAFHWPGRLEAAPAIVHKVPPFDRDAMMIEVELLLDWYVPAASGGAASASDRDAFLGAWHTVFDRLEGAEKSLVLRDYHSPNII